MEKINLNNVEELKAALFNICACDEDLNGNNGIEYTWQVAREAGYKTSAEYLADKVVEEHEGEHFDDIIVAFLEEIIKRDYWYESYYYDRMVEGDYMYISATLIQRKE